MALTTNLTAYFNFQSNVNDSVGSHNGTAHNSPTFTSGHLGNALTLTGASSQYVSLPQAVIPFGTNTLSVNLWVKFTSTSGNQSMIMTAETGQGFLFYLTAGGVDLGKPNVVDCFYNPWSGADTNWHMWTAVTDGSGMRIYLDGNSTPVQTSANTSNWVAPSTDLIQVGGYSSGGSLQAGWYMSGQQQLMGFWSRALSSTEITQLYNGGAGLAYPFPGGNFLAFMG